MQNAFSSQPQHGGSLPYALLEEAKRQLSLLPSGGTHVDQEQLRFALLLGVFAPHLVQLPPQHKFATASYVAESLVVSHHMNRNVANRIIDHYNGILGTSQTGTQSCLKTQVVPVSSLAANKGLATDETLTGTDIAIIKECAVPFFSGLYGAMKRQGQESPLEAGLDSVASSLGFQYPDNTMETLDPRVSRSLDMILSAKVTSKPVTTTRVPNSDTLGKDENSATQGSVYPCSTSASETTNKRLRSENDAVSDVMQGKRKQLRHDGNGSSFALPTASSAQTEEGGQSKRICVPIKPPVPSKFQGNTEKYSSYPVPEFTSLVNFPAHMSRKHAINMPEGMRCCVMCGQACPCSSGNKGKNKSKPYDGGMSCLGQSGDKKAGQAVIPAQNKGLCTICDVNVWVVVSSGLEIKWCKGCKNFCTWAAFGDKGLATKCICCRERQREKYALQKEEKEKARAAIIAKAETQLQTA